MFGTQVEYIFQDNHVTLVFGHCDLIMNIFSKIEVNSYQGDLTTCWLFIVH